MMIRERITPKSGEERRRVEEDGMEKIGGRADT